MHNILSVHIEKQRSNDTVQTVKLCLDCALERFLCEEPENLIRVLESMPLHATVVYGSEGMPEDNEDFVFGKVCDNCHTPLAAWRVCKFCGGVDWLDSIHTCYAFTDAMNSDKRTKAYRLYDDVMNGFEVGFQEDGFTGDQW